MDIKDNTVPSPNGQVPPMPNNEAVEKRKKGAQPGNTNALKNGLYIHHKHVHNINPIEKAALYNLTDHIKYLKDYLAYLYEVGKKQNDIYLINDTARSLAVISIALGRLIHVHELHSAEPLPPDLLGIDYYDPDYQPDQYKDPTLDEIEAKLKELGA